MSWFCGARRLVAAAILAASAPSWGVDFTGRADLGYNRSNGTAFASDGYRQNYTLTMQHPVTSALGYRLSLRYQDDHSRSFGATGGRFENAQWAPSGEAVFRSDRLDARAGGELLADDSRIGGGGVDLHSERTRVRAFADTRIELAEPTDLRFSADRLSTRAPALAGVEGAARVDLVENRASATLDYEGSHLRLLQTTRVEQLENTPQQFSRLIVGPRLAADYRQGFLANALTVGARFSVDYNQMKESALSPAGITVAPRQVAPVAGLYVADDPVDGHAPLQPFGPLTDRNLDVSAGIALGPDGGSFQNVGVDMGRVTAVDRLRIHVRDQEGRLLADGGPIGWTVYASDNGLDWRAVSPVLARYDTALGLYDISFPIQAGDEPGAVPTAPVAQHFKAVSFGVNTVRTYVTEVEAFVDERFQPHETKLTSTLLNSASFTLGARAAEKLTFAYYGLVNDSRLWAETAPLFHSYDWSHVATASAGPFRATTFTVSHTQRSATQGGRVTRSGMASTAGLRFLPVQQAEAEVELRRTYDQALVSATPNDSTIYGVGLRGRADVLPPLRLLASAEYSLQELQIGGSRRYVTASGSTLARLTRALDLSLNGAVQVLVYGGESDANDPFPRVTDYQRYYAEASYHPSVQLNLLARLGYTIAATSGVLQNYRVSWNPFPDGAIQLGFDYGEDVDALTGNSSRRLSFWPRWNLNRHTYIDVNYTLVTNRLRLGDGTTFSRVGQLFATLSVSI